MPEESIENATGATDEHSHEGVTSEDRTLYEHLRQVHDLEAVEGLSAATLEGLHDRLHGTSKAADD
ncbi:MAG: hypothetical protein ABR540_12675 [Acidimicrobiales bacterium]